MSKINRSKDFPLVVRAQQNPQHFALLYNKYYKGIFIYILKKINNEELTADITSKVFLKAMLNIKKYEDRGFPFSSWLYKIASNEVNKHFRDEKKVQEVEIQEKDAICLMQDIDEDQKTNQLNKLTKCLVLLKKDQSDIIEMRFFEKLSFNEIGEILGITGNNAKIRLYRAVDQLKKIFKANP